MIVKSKRAFYGIFFITPMTDINADDKLVAVMLRKRRRDLEISQQAVAERAGMVQSVVSKIEAGDRKVSVGELRAILQALDLRLDEFVGEFLARTKA